MKATHLKGFTDEANQVNGNDKQIINWRMKLFSLQNLVIKLR